MAAPRDARRKPALPAYRLRSAQELTPARRRATGLALAIGVNAGLLLVLLTLGVIPLPQKKTSNATVVDLIPESHSRAAAPAHASTRPLPKPPPIILPVKPSIRPPPTQARKAPPLLELSHDEMASADLRNVSPGDSEYGDSEEVGRGPHGEILYAAEWAREPTDAELGGYLPRNATDGWGLIACKTIPGNRVDNCFVLGESPLGSHLGRAVEQAAWQFRVRPPRKGGKPLIGEWVRIRIEYEGRGG